MVGARTQQSEMPDQLPGYIREMAHSADLRRTRHAITWSRAGGAKIEVSKKKGKTEQRK